MAANIGAKIKVAGSKIASQSSKADSQMIFPSNSVMMK